MRKFLQTLLFFIAVLSSMTISMAEENSFLDIDKHWAKQEIEMMIKDGAIGGYDDNSFKPDKEVTLAEFIKMLLIETNAKLVMQGNRWPDWYINTAKSKNYISDNILVDTNKLLSRKEACAILSKYIGLEDVKKGKNIFSDLSSDSKDTILKLVNLGIVSGYEDGSFRENEFVTRAQACKMILASYDARVNLLKNRKATLNHKNTNIGEVVSGDFITQNRYEISDKRIYIIDNKKSFVNKTTLNQEYVDDSKIIKLINALVDDDSYTEVLFVPNKDIINTLNVSYGNRESYVHTGDYNINIALYENAKFDVAKATDTITFSNHAFARVTLRKLWDRLHEYDTELSASNKNLYKLEEVFGSLTETKYKKEICKYIIEKIKLAKSLPENEFEAKILESKKFGKYTLDVMCTRDAWLEIYVSYN